MALNLHKLPRFLLGISFLFSYAGVPCYLAAREAQSPGEALGKPHLRPGDLCQKLAEIRPGQIIPIEAAGLYFNGMVWDPLTPECEFDVQPTVFAEFSPAIEDLPIAKKVAERRMPTMIAFRGQLHGPPQLRPDDIDASPMIAYLERVADRGYGPRKLRVKLILSDILGEREDYPKYPETKAVTRDPAPSLIRQMSLPKYQYQAWFAGLEGEVEIEVDLGEGKVKDSRLVSGDRLLALTAFDHLKTWQVDPDRTDTLSVTYSYNLELRRSGEQREPRIIMNLPNRIEIWALRHGWN